jgi:hypothetical protein
VRVRCRTVGRRLSRPHGASSAAQRSARPAGGPGLDEVYALVERRSPRVRAADALARAAAARVPGVTRPSDPQLQLGFMNYSLPRLRPDETLGMAQLQLMQMLPTGGKLSAAGGAARARAEAAGARAADAAWSVRMAAAMAFYERYEAAGAVAIARETRRLLEDAAAVAGAMYRVGDGRQADVLRARVEIARMDEEVVRMTATQDAASRGSPPSPTPPSTRSPGRPRSPPSRRPFPSARSWSASPSSRGRCSPPAPPTSAPRRPSSPARGASCGPTCRWACSTASGAWTPTSTGWGA